MSPNAPDPPNDDIPVQVGVASDVANDDQDGLTTVLSVSGGQVEFAAKGSLVTPMGCANRCRIRVWTDTANANTFTPVSDQELTAAAATTDQVDYTRTLPQGSKIRYEGFLDVTITPMSDKAKVHRRRTKVKPA